jgi:DNA mismatch repair endonuclease MutH
MLAPDLDLTSPQSILKHAARLSGKTLAEVVELLPDDSNSRNKGNLGSMVERHHYNFTPGNSAHQPDFPEAGVELKTTGVVRNRDGNYRAKERLVLTMINYMDIVAETWEQSSLMQKCRLMLILFYLYDKSTPVHHRRFVLNPILFTFPESDIAVIRRDWETIRQKVLDGKAHELSEGDTYYLGACRKGSGGTQESLRKQPFSHIPAKSRAFCLKPSYVNQIISGQTTATTLPITHATTIETAADRVLRPYIGKTVTEIAKQLGIHKQGKNDKGFYRNLAVRMLGGSGRTIPELEKASVELKTIRVNQAWQPAEAMSFPGFKYLEIINEQWENSSFCTKIEQKFLLVVFRTNENGELVFATARFWNMPFPDRQEARRVWQETKRRISIDAANLPKSSDSHVAHVRPKARNAQDTLPTPQGTMLVKKCFWLNREYIANIIASIRPDKTQKT